MTRPHVRRRPVRDPVTVVVDGTRAHLEGADLDELQLLVMAAGVDRQWTDGRWTFPAADALTVASALRAADRSVHLASGTAS